MPISVVMADILDQNEVDALLASVEGAEPSFADPAVAPPSPAAASRPAASAERYDFKRPERVSKDQIRALFSIHEVFARNFGATLSGFLRTLVDVRVVGVEQLTYNEFIQSLPNPTCFMVLEAPPLEGQMCMELSPLIVYPIIDRLLGGIGTASFVPQRPLSSIEWRLIDRIVQRALEHLSEVWRNLVAAEFGVVQTESNPQLVHIVAPTEVVVFVTLEIKLGNTSDTMSLAIPFNTIESVLSHLSTQSWFYKPKQATDLQTQRVTRNLIKGSLNLVAYLGQSPIRLSELRNLRPGDVIGLDKAANAELVLQIAGRNKFAGSIGQVRGHRALQISREAQHDETL